MSVIYSSGDFLIFVGASGTVILPAQSDAALLQSVWEDLRQEKALTELGAMFADGFVSDAVILDGDVKFVAGGEGISYSTANMPDSTANVPEVVATDMPSEVEVASPSEQLASSSQAVASPTSSPAISSESDMSYIEDATIFAPIVIENASQIQSSDSSKPGFSTASEPSKTPEMGTSSGNNAPLADDDHDGMTIASFAAVTSTPAYSSIPTSGPDSFPGSTPTPESAVASPTPPVPASDVIQILGRICQSCQSPNSTQRVACIKCVTPLTGDAQLLPRPSLGTIRLSTGKEYELDQPMIFGRRPKATRFSNDDVPRLITLTGELSDISRSHLGIVLQEWNVLVGDMNSTNGTILRRVGEKDRRLQSSDEVIARVGDVFDLGNDITITVTRLL